MPYIVAKHSKDFLTYIRNGISSIRLWTYRFSKHVMRNYTAYLSYLSG